MSSRSHHHGDLPGWPALMDLALAEDYTCLGEDAFKTLMLKHGVRPVDLGNSSVRWRRADIDQVIDKLPMRPTKSPDAAQPGPPDPQVIDLADPILVGLERSRRRAR